MAATSLVKTKNCCTCNLLADWMNVSFDTVGCVYTVTAECLNCWLHVAVILFIFLCCFSAKYQHLANVYQSYWLFALIIYSITRQNEEKLAYLQLRGILSVPGESRSCMCLLSDKLPTSKLSLSAALLRVPTVVRTCLLAQLLAPRVKCGEVSEH